jgi:hypothetical protein
VQKYCFFKTYLNTLPGMTELDSLKINLNEFFSDVLKIERHYHRRTYSIEGTSKSSPDMMLCAEQTLYT